jgi:hypothetical protein
MKQTVSIKKRFVATKSRDAAIGFFQGSLLVQPGKQRLVSLFNGSYRNATLCKLVSKKANYRPRWALSLMLGWFGNPKRDLHHTMTWKWHWKPLRADWTRKFIL